MIKYVKKAFRESLLSENWIEEDMKIALVKKVTWELYAPCQLGNYQRVGRYLNSKAAFAFDSFLLSFCAWLNVVLMVSGNEFNISIMFLTALHLSSSSKLFFWEPR